MKMRRNVEKIQTYLESKVFLWGGGLPEEEHLLEKGWWQGLGIFSEEEKEEGRTWEGMCVGAEMQREKGARSAELVLVCVPLIVFPLNLKIGKILVKGKLENSLKIKDLYMQHASRKSPVLQSRWVVFFPHSSSSSRQQKPLSLSLPPCVCYFEKKGSGFRSHVVWLKGKWA